MAFRIPKPLSPQAHRVLDLIALPGLFTLTLWLRGRNTTAATVVLTNALIEGATQLATDYTPRARPRGNLRWLSLRDHLRITAVYGGFLAGVGMTLTGLRTQDRRLILALAASAPVLAALTDSGESQRPRDVRRWTYVPPS